MLTRLIIFIGLISFCLKSHAQIADEIIKKHIEAIGGYDKIKAIKTMIFEGTTTFKDHEKSFKSYIIHDSANRTENSEPGKSGYGILTKVDGWTYNSDDNSIKKKSGDEIKKSQIALDLHGPLVDYKEKGNRVRYFGKESIENKKCLKLKVIKPDKTVLIYFFDTSYFVARIIVHPAEAIVVKYTIDYSYMLVEGGYFFISKAISLESGAQTSYKYYLVNPEIDRALFSPR